MKKFMIFVCFTLPFTGYCQQIVKGVPNFVLFSGGFAKPNKIPLFDYQAHSGFVVGEKGDTLKGEFKFSNDLGQEAIYWRENADKSFEVYPLKNSNYINLNGTEFFRFTEISKKDWLRKIAVKSGVTLYDQSLLKNESNNYINTSFLVLEDSLKNRKQFPNFSNGNTKRAMIRFFNQASGENIPYKRFKNKDEFIQFFLEK
jgi:hypothetical protein